MHWFCSSNERKNSWCRNSVFAAHLQVVPADVSIIQQYWCGAYLIFRNLNQTWFQDAVIQTRVFNGKKPNRKAAMLWDEYTDSSECERGPEGRWINNAEKLGKDKACFVLILDDQTKRGLIKISISIPFSSLLPRGGEYRALNRSFPLKSVSMWSLTLVMSQDSCQKPLRKYRDIRSSNQRACWHQRNKNHHMSAGKWPYIHSYIP